MREAGAVAVLFGSIHAIHRLLEGAAEPDGAPSVSSCETATPDGPAELVSVVAESYRISPQFVKPRRAPAGGRAGRGRPHASSPIPYSPSQAPEPGSGPIPTATASMSSSRKWTRSTLHASMMKRAGSTWWRRAMRMALGR